MDELFEVDKRYRVLPDHEIQIKFLGHDVIELIGGEEFKVEKVTGDTITVLQYRTRYIVAATAISDVEKID
ncbi:MAG: hypothetical protein UX44_C0032G0010 [candidate division WWE3 bacterium GW2011_GWA1_46_21]|uniref:Uncharacterized protein n=2 Tax=Katanobacteria TaxID=422282 RepID=A0A0G1S8X8_UNCKA|nr:MAG: hypothetical protein UX44_C0032G0010 [candidate division WWE3 bacterium GW2011_GWA1_46_21]KKU50653.1 MAG: hypothetical protein UX73_C0018G0009 [candidate division WWE3 bacterium GW2011_GWC1_47_10]